jgi:hypothetical protein
MKNFLASGRLKNITSRLQHGIRCFLRQHDKQTLRISTIIEIRTLNAFGAAMFSKSLAG